MKILILFLFIINCSISSSAYDKELKSCKNTINYYNFFQLKEFEKLNDPTLSEIEKDNIYQLLLVFSFIPSCKEILNKRGYVNGPLP